MAFSPAKKFKPALLATIVVGSWCGFSFTLPVRGQGQGQERTQNPLNGGVEKADKFKHAHGRDPLVGDGPPVPGARLPIEQWQTTIAPHLKAGLIWHDEWLPREATSVEWVRIPPWLAGQWHVEHAYFVPDITGKKGPETVNREDDSFGWQQDRSGAYWHLLRSPVLSVTDSETFFSRFIHYRQTAQTLTVVQFSQGGENMEVRVAKSDGRIIAVNRRHDVYTWFTVGGSVRADDHVSFLDNGVAPRPASGSLDRIDGTIKMRPEKAGPFLRVDVSKDGFQARQSFIDFLRSRGLGQLIPDS